MEDRLRAADIVDRMIDRHGDSIFYSKLLINFVRRSPPSRLRIRSEAAQGQALVCSRV